jgi:hypothetical protein
MRGRRNDSLVSNGRAPSRVGASLLFAGITGVTLSANTEWTGWSAMNGLGQSAEQAVDTWSYSAGAELRIAGMGGADLPLRLGARWRTLPYQADSQNVKETEYTVGFGIPVSNGRGRFDFALVRALRSAPVPAKESAWIFNVGILVRP